MFDLGIEVPMEILQGMWSEVFFARGRARVLGKVVVQLTVVKNHSSGSRRGDCCILLHVKALPFRGISTKPRWPIRALKSG